MALQQFGVKHPETANDPIFKYVDQLYRVAPGVLLEHGKTKSESRHSFSGGEHFDLYFSRRRADFRFLALPQTRTRTSTLPRARSFTTTVLRPRSTTPSPSVPPAPWEASPSSFGTVPSACRLSDPSPSAWRQSSSSSSREEKGESPFFMKSVFPLIKTGPPPDPFVGLGAPGASS